MFVNMRTVVLYLSRISPEIQSRGVLLYVPCHPCCQVFGHVHLLLVVRVQQDQAVEVSITNVANDGSCVTKICSLVKIILLIRIQQICRLVQLHVGMRVRILN